MRNITTFVLGFVLAIVIAGAGVSALLQAMSANAIPQTPAPSATVQLSETPVAVTDDTPTATPEQPLTPVVTRPSLSWRWAGDAQPECASLSIDQDGELRYGDCHGSTTVAYLTPDELAAWLEFVTRYAAFDLNTGQAGGQSVRFVGRGPSAPDLAQQQAVADWAKGVYARLEDHALQADRAAQARVMLAARLGVPVASTQVLSVDAVMWPNACLGIDVDGQMCAQVLTPGYRVRLLVDGVGYVYHTDRHGQMIVAEAQPAPTAVATPLPTHTAVPTPTAMPTPTVVPTAIPRPTATPVPTATPLPTPYPFVVTDWLGEYYNNTSLSGSPALARNDVDIDFDWAYSSPGWGVNSDHFAVRWSRKLWFEDGDYTFTLAADDGVRLWVAGNLLIDRWYGGERTTTVTQQIWRGWHEVKIEYFELEGIARARFAWSRIVPTPTPTLTYSMWVAEYFDNHKLAGQPVVVRNEKQIEFDWRDGSPDKRVPNDRFSARFTHTLNFAPGTYELRVVVDDGVRVYVDDRLVIDAWETGIRRELMTRVQLGGDHRVRIEYFEYGEGAALFFGWDKVTDGSAAASSKALQVQ